MREWKILRNGKLWSDRFNSEQDAHEAITRYSELDDKSEFEIVEMTESEINQYYS